MPDQSQLQNRQRTLDRAAWGELRPTGEIVTCKVTVKHGVDIEGDDGTEASITVHEDGVDVRVGDLQLIVDRKRVALVQKHPPYPISRWTVLWEGELT